MDLARKLVADEKRVAERNGEGAGLAGWLLVWVRGIARKGLGNLQRSRGQRRMELLETLQLGGKRQLMLVVCDGQRYLVGAGGDAVNSIEAMTGVPVNEQERMHVADSDDTDSFAMGRTQ